VTRVEDRLAELLHSAVPPSHGVAFDDVRRRVRRRRAVGWPLATAAAAAAVVVAVVSVAGNSGSGRPEPVTTPPSVNLAGTVPWVDHVAAPYRAPAVPQSPSPGTHARACTAGDVTASLADGGAAGGHVERYVRFRNTSPSTCVLKGYPRVTASQPGQPSVAGTDGSFFPSFSTANMRPGQDTYLGVETDTYCAARPGGGSPGPLYHRLDVTLPGGGTVTVTDAANGFDVSCGLHLTRFFVQQPEPHPVHDPLSDLTVSLEVPPTVAAGSTLDYVADVTNPTDRPVSLARCPGYVEAASGSTPIKEAYGLNCAPVGAIAAHHTVRFAMRLHVPHQAAGPLTFHWSMAAPFSVTSQATVTVTAPGSPTSGGVVVDGVLRMTGGPAGAPQPGVPGSVWFDAVATGRRYPTAAAADGSFTLTVPPGAYTVTGSSPQFAGGSQSCRADGTVQISASGLSGVVVACPHR
jgi:hypothetical protein